MTEEQLQTEKADLYSWPVVFALNAAKMVALIVSIHFIGGML
jgi:hypothetical protein